MWKQRILFLSISGLLLVLVNGVKPVMQADGSAEIPAETKYVALTFDDGPRSGTTDRLLDGLKERGASATFFVVGEQAQEQTDLLRRMQEEGHQVGNHTWSHVNLKEIPQESALREVEQCQTLLEKTLGQKNYWLRPPYGQTTAAAREKIPYPMVQWSVDPRDWESRNTEQVIHAVETEVQANSIILLHDIYPTSVDAALQIVEDLEQQGYWFVTVEELMQLNGISVEAGQVYHSGNKA